MTRLEEAALFTAHVLSEMRSADAGQRDLYSTALARRWCKDYGVNELSFLLSAAMKAAPDDVYQAMLSDYLNMLSDPVESVDPMEVEIERQRTDWLAFVCGRSSRPALTPVEKRRAAKISFTDVP